MRSLIGYLGFLAGIWGAPIVAFADDDSLERPLLSAISNCRTIEDSLERLTCFDDIEVLEQIPPDAVDEGEADEEELDTVAPAKGWTLIESEDAVSGADISRVYVDADQLLNGNNSPEFLMMQCDGDGGFDLFVGTTGYLGISMSNRVEVSYRWGENEPIAERWSSSTTGRAAFLPQSYNDFMSGLEIGGELAFQWTGFNGGRYSSVWNDIQLDENARFVMSGCN